jgi:hypothetical protein
VHKDEKLMLVLYGVAVLALWVSLFVKPWDVVSTTMSALGAIISTCCWMALYRKVKQNIVDRVIRRLERGEQ